MPVAANNSTAIHLDSESARATLGTLDGLDNELEQDTRGLRGALAEAEAGDRRHGYLDAGLRAGYEAASLADTALAELRDALRNADATVRALESYDLDTAVGAADVALPVLPIMPAALAVPPTAAQLRAAVADADEAADAVVNVGLETPAAFDVLLPVDDVVPAPPIATVPASPVIGGAPTLSLEPSQPPVPAPAQVAPIPQQIPAPPVVEEKKGWWDRVTGWFEDFWNAMLDWLGRQGTIGKQVANLLSGFVTGEPRYPEVGGGAIVAFIGDVLAGLVFYGDIRDIGKYIWKWIEDDEPWWVCLIVIVLSLIGLVPVWGDAIKIIGKGILKFVKSLLKSSLKGVGKQFGEKLIAELGDELAEWALKQLGPETLNKLAAELGEEGAVAALKILGPDTIKKMVDELGVDGAISLIKDLGPTTLSALLRELSPREVQQLAEPYGRTAIEEVLKLPGLTPRKLFKLSQFGSVTAAKALALLRTNGMTIDRALQLLRLAQRGGIRGALLDELIASPGLQRVLLDEGPETLLRLWVDWKARKGSLGSKSFTEYVGYRGFRTGQADNPALMSLWPDFARLSVREQNQRLLESSEARLAEALMSGNLPTSVQERIENLLKYELIRGATHLRDARQRVMGPIYRVLGNRATNVDDFHGIVDLITHGNGKGLIGEYFARNHLLERSTRIQKTPSFKDVPGITVNPFRPDRIRTSARRTLDIKTGYSKTGIDIEQLRNYQRLRQRSEIPGSEVAQKLHNDYGMSGPIEGHDYLFLPGNSAAEKNARVAAKRAYIRIESAGLSDAADVYFMDAQGTIWRLDAPGSVQRIGSYLPS